VVSAVVSAGADESVVAAAAHSSDGSLVEVSSVGSVSPDDVNIPALTTIPPVELVLAESPPPTRSARSLVSSLGSGSLMNWV
jgi:hypothetical protein